MVEAKRSLLQRLFTLVSWATLVVALVLGPQVLGEGKVPDIGLDSGTWTVAGEQPLAAQVAPASAESVSGEDAAEAHSAADFVNPAVVTVTNLQAGSVPFSGRSDALQAVGVGSGFIIDSEGRVLTNNHVVEGAEALSVEFADGTTVEATLLGSDAFQDVAVLQINMDDITGVPAVATLGTAETVEFGETVVAIGTALGEYPNTVTAGSVEAVDQALDTGLGYALANLVQHDAELWPGNSGGPLINLEGEVIGMNVAGSSTYGQRAAGAQVGFAIEIDAVMEIADELIADGEVDRPFLGIESAPDRSGQRVADLVDGGPAEEAGLEVNDVIIAVDDQEIDRDHPLLNMLFEHEPGDTVTLTIERDGEEQTFDVVLGERPAETS